MEYCNVEKAFGAALQPGYAGAFTYLMNYCQYGGPYMAALPSWEHKEGENCIFDQDPTSLLDSDRNA